MDSNSSGFWSPRDSNPNGFKSRDPASDTDARANAAIIGVNWQEHA